MNINRFHKQSGATLMEVMIAMSISLVVTAAMIAMMSNSLGTTARIIKMTKLTDDMRVAMQMMTREVRRTNYDHSAIECYGNLECSAISETGANLTGIYDDAVKDCLTFDFDRTQTDEADAAGGVRRIVNDDGIGVLEIWTGAAGTSPICDPGTEGWVEVTNPKNMNITNFLVEDDLSYSEVVLEDIDGKKVTQTVRKIRMSMSGELLLDSSITRYMEDMISIRNNLISVEYPVGA